MTDVSLVSSADIRDDVECDREARLVAMKGQCAVPEIRREKHKEADFGTNRQLGV